MPYCVSLADALSAAEALDAAATSTSTKFTALWKRASAQVQEDLARAACVVVPVPSGTPPDDDSADLALLRARDLETLLTSARCLLSMGSAGPDAAATAEDLLRQYRELVDAYNDDTKPNPFLLNNGATAATTPSTALVTASAWTDEEALPPGHEEEEYLRPREFEDWDKP